MITWKWVVFAATVFMSAMLAAAIIYSSFPLAVIGFGVSVPVIYFSKMKAKAAGHLVEDELTWKISADAALWTVMILMPAVAVASIILIIGSGHIGEWAEYAGYTLSMVVLAFGLLYTVLSLYGNRKMGRE